MMKKRKWIYISLILLLVLPILILYNAFNGNPLSKWIAASTLNKYLQETYPNQEFNTDKGFYNFKIGGYSFDVNKIGGEDQENYEFNVTGFFQPTVTYDEIYYANLDEPLIEKWQEEAAVELQDIFKDIQAIVYIEVQLEVLKDSYAFQTDWDKDLQLEKPMYIHVLMDAGQLSKTELVEEMKKMQRDLESAGYTYDVVNINANLFDEDLKDDQGYVKYASSFTEDQKISLRDIEEYDQ
ncbi:YfjL-like protein [Bacillus sp. SD088]|uniref:YfjL-like protein n=1 Tax=Bacillus sp. SD088 TaxID=2782012 RepID=UPI001A976524|nr:hypothetical protein [Bacillus sp. SD088]MBO0991707.1 hypothetical protein [Bacillus sp. SD088]